MSCFNSFCVVLQPRKQNILFWIVGSFVCDINFRWGVYIPGLVEIYVLSMGKRTCAGAAITSGVARRVSFLVFGRAAVQTKFKVPFNKKAYVIIYHTITPFARTNKGCSGWRSTRIKKKNL